ncbi:MAG: hypothetical protein M1376_20660 [Planctomycetes bacterium]|nr:hypothetical protein [Planctomycetota bacterium]
MRLWCAGILCLAALLPAGCNEEQKTADANRKKLDTELVNTVNNLQVENAIVTQHTLYPYHFVTGGAGLNDLGRRDLMVLARHYQENPGALNVRRGETDEALYKARVAQVQKRLKEAGVDVGRMTIADGMPGGPGMPSEAIVTVKPKVTGGSSTTGGGSSGRSSSGSITR